MSRTPYPTYHSRNWGMRHDFIQTLRDSGSPGALSAVSSLDAAFWLLAVGQTAQAVFLLHHTLEIALKGLLEEVHVLLTLDRLDYELAKGLVLSRLQAHRLARGITNPDPKINLG